MLRIIFAAALAVLALAALGGREPRPAAAAPVTVTVTSSADGGPGSFRAAIQQANANSSIGTIQLRNALPITLTSTVQYTGTQALTIQGDSPVLYRTIQGWPLLPGNPNVEPLECGMFRSTGGADVTFFQVTLQYSWCDALNIAPAPGDDEIVITLNKVVLRNNYGSGMFLHEIEEAEGAIRLNVTSSIVSGNGRCRGAGGCAFGGIELQGVGQGAIVAQVSGSAFTGNGGDGLSVVWDEADVTTAPPPPLDVDLAVTATNTSFSGNGGSVGGGGGVAESGGRGGPSIASHQSGNGLTVVGNGLGAGSVTVTLNNVQANGNAGDGIAAQEGVPENDDEAGLAFSATSVLVWGNDDDGIDLSEFGDGALGVTLTSTSIWSNDDNGTEAREDGDGNFTFQVTGSSSYRNGRDGFDLEQQDGPGDLVAGFEQVTVTANGRDGIHGEDDNADGIMFSLTGCTIALNGEDAIDLTAEGAPGALAPGGSIILGDVELKNVVQVP